MNTSSIVHSTFVVERTYPASAARVFAAFSDPAIKRRSASLASVELVASGKGTRLVYTEQGQFFDGADQPKQRELGCAELFDKLGEELKKSS